ncbi:unnamed protein product [Moneuplotes crassus]|uniref:Uncharacterized protein n=1 Tax=Euplotes crassus TaxID=5936 RepID=A0AAD1Y2R9_EUPCR|nr:unnamed protein product [Moneuplotes crassus]
MESEHPTAEAPASSELQMPEQTVKTVEKKVLDGEEVTLVREDAVLDTEQEDKLLKFLNKVQGVYEKDSSLPEILGDSLKTWIGEIEDKKTKVDCNDGDKKEDAKEESVE